MRFHSSVTLTNMSN